MRWQTLLPFTTEPMDIKRTISAYYERLYAHKFNNVDEMDQLLERYNLLKHKEKQILLIGLYLLNKLNQYLITF